MHLNQIRSSFQSLFRNQDRVKENFRLMSGWSTLVYMICSDIVKTTARAGVSKDELQEYPYITKLDEENGRLVFEVETSSQALKLVLKKNIIEPMTVMSTKTCMVCAANCEHVAAGIERSLCTVCERNYQRRQYSRLDSVEFISRVAAESRKPESNIAVISITELGDDPAALKEGWHTIYRARFDDLNPVNREPFEPPHDHEDPIDDARAKSIVDFVDGIAPEVDGIVVHCRAGISRSAAVAKWIAQAYGLDFDEDYTAHNEFVYDMLIKAAER
ncbi:dual specificity phosphatase, catalytic domain [mine drainage metagenome]|uniref:Dual specificity phosphatase, catalytic domain n=1 Tax=mine drainage metagenome TaxID=410659 RepID=A0A1J5R0S9_9ZZZZ